MEFLVTYLVTYLVIYLVTEGSDDLRTKPSKVFSDLLSNVFGNMVPDDPTLSWMEYFVTELMKFSGAGYFEPN